jgi:hypothetical protein
MLDRALVRLGRRFLSGGGGILGGLLLGLAALVRLLLCRLGRPEQLS